MCEGTAPARAPPDGCPPGWMPKHVWRDRVGKPTRQAPRARLADPGGRDGHIPGRHRRQARRDARGRRGMPVVAAERAVRDARADAGGVARQRPRAGLSVPGYRIFRARPASGPPHPAREHCRPVRPGCRSSSGRAAPCRRHHTREWVPSTRRHPRVPRAIRPSIVLSEPYLKADFRAMAASPTACLALSTTAPVPKNSWVTPA